MTKVPHARRATTAIPLAVISVVSLAWSASAAVSPPTGSGKLRTGPNPQGPVSAVAESRGAAQQTDPDTVYRRSQYWVQKNVPYSQSSYANAVSDPVGPYRTDCSGFISMAWGLDSSFNTASLPDVSTPISKDQLRRGDILDYRSASGAGNNSHVVMFVRWANAAHTQYVENEEAGSVGAVERTISYPYDEPMDGSGSWVPFRYKNITGGGSASVYENGQYHVFGISPGGSLFQRTWSGSWGDWQNLGGTVKGTPAATYLAGQFDVFALNTAGGMVQKTWTAGTGWSPWKTVGGILAGGIGATHQTGAYHVFGISPGGSLFQRTWSGSWGDWQNLGNTVTGTPSVVYHSNQYDVFAISPAGPMYQKTWIQGGTGWSGWKALGGIFNG